jgi:uncharacterized integral membrane protein
MKPKIIIIVVLVALFAVLLIQNIQVVTYRLFFWKISVSQVILVPLAMLVGFIIGFTVAKVTGSRKKSRYVSEEE